MITQDALGRLLAVITNKRDRAMFLLAYRHGLRASEVWLLHTTNLDLNKLRICSTGSKVVSPESTRCSRTRPRP